MTGALLYAVLAVGQFAGGSTPDPFGLLPPDGLNEAPPTDTGSGGTGGTGAGGTGGTGGTGGGGTGSTGSYQPAPFSGSFSFSGGDGGASGSTPGAPSYGKDVAAVDTSNNGSSGGGSGSASPGSGSGPGSGSFSGVLNLPNPLIVQIQNSGSSSGEFSLPSNLPRWFDSGSQSGEQMIGANNGLAVGNGSGGSSANPGATIGVYAGNPGGAGGPFGGDVGTYTPWDLNSAPSAPSVTSSQTQYASTAFSNGVNGGSSAANSTWGASTVGIKYTSNPQDLNTTFAIPMPGGGNANVLLSVLPQGEYAWVGPVNLVRSAWLAFCRVGICVFFLRKAFGLLIAM